MAKNAYFSYPSLICRPRSLDLFPSEFRAEVNHGETRVMGLSSSEDGMIVAMLTRCKKESRAVAEKPHVRYAIVKFDRPIEIDNGIAWSS